MHCIPFYSAGHNDCCVLGNIGFNSSAPRITNQCSISNCGCTCVLSVFLNVLLAVIVLLLCGSLLDEFLKRWEVPHKFGLHVTT